MCRLVVIEKTTAPPQLTEVDVLPTKTTLFGNFFDLLSVNKSKNEMFIFD
jgi:hypothetical protein